VQGGSARRRDADAGAQAVRQGSEEVFLPKLVDGNKEQARPPEDGRVDHLLGDHLSGRVREGWVAEGVVKVDAREAAPEQGNRAQVQVLRVQAEVARVQHRAEAP